MIGSSESTFAQTSASSLHLLLLLANSFAVLNTLCWCNLFRGPAMVLFAFLVGIHVAGTQ